MDGSFLFLQYLQWKLDVCPVYTQSIGNKRRVASFIDLSLPFIITDRRSTKDIRLNKNRRCYADPLYKLIRVKYLLLWILGSLL